jgi:hypothetical protein
MFHDDVYTGRWWETANKEPTHAASLTRTRLTKRRGAIPVRRLPGGPPGCV